MDQQPSPQLHFLFSALGLSLLCQQRSDNILLSSTPFLGVRGKEQSWIVPDLVVPMWDGNTKSNSGVGYSLPVVSHQVLDLSPK